MRPLKNFCKKMVISDYFYSQGRSGAVCRGGKDARGKTTQL